MTIFYFSIYCSKRCRSLSSDLLPSYIKAQGFSILDLLFFNWDSLIPYCGKIHTGERHP